MKIFFMCTHANQGTGYARSANKITNYLADQPGIEVVYFAFQNYSNQTITDRFIDPRIKFIDAVLIDPESPKGFGDNAIVPALLEENPDILFIYNDISVCESIIKKVEYANIVVPKTYLYLDIVYPWEDINRYRYLDGKVDHCFVFLNCWKTHMCADLKWAESKVSVLPLGVDLDQFGVLSDQFGAKKQFSFEPYDFVVLNMNRNSYRKQWCTTIKAFLLFLKGTNMNRNVKLMCSCLLKTDDGYDIVKIIETQCMRLGMDAQTVTTNHIFSNPNALVMTESAVNALYNACDVGINTCCGEGFGLVNMEHASLGRPQILAGVPAFKETLGEHAIIIEPTLWTTVSSFEDHGGEIAHFDPADFAAALNDVYTHKVKMRSNVKKHIESTYNWDSAYQALDRVFSP